MRLMWIQRLSAIALGFSSPFFGFTLPAAIALPLAAPVQFFVLPQRNYWLQINGFSGRSRATPIQLWATYYHIHQATAAPAGEPLLNKAGQSLGVTLSHRDWCHAALQGTVQVQQSGRLTLYNFAGRGSSPQTDCSPYFKSLSDDVLDQLNRVRFTPTSGPLGYGTGRYRLVPYRTIAVDRSQIPLGSVVYIPAARGQRVTLPSGDRVYHDGFFFAADVGSNIQGNHIDVFLGLNPRNPFPFISSSPNQTFKAYVIQDPEINRALAQLHR
jgi:3D (Asp-Asp-Asp) domain-containing protein